MGKQNKKIIHEKRPESKASVQIADKASRKVSGQVKLALLLGVVSFFVYANTLKNSFAFDDVNSITENTIVQQGTSAIPELFVTPYHRGNYTTTNDLYRPLSLVMFAIEYQVFGMEPTNYHLINILMFTGCVVLLFFFLNQLFERKKIAVAFIAALLFALHPIHTEVVANIKSRDELLCFFFAFSSLLIFMRYVRTGKMLALLFGSACFFLSFLSKESSVTFLAVIPLVFFFYNNENKKRSIYVVAAAVIITTICLTIRFSVLSYYHANDIANIPFIDNALASKDISIWSRTATAILILGYYVKLLFVPYPLLCDYSYSTIPFAHFSDPFVIISLALYVFLAIFSIVRLIKKRRDPYAFGILFFLITISLFTNIPFLMDTTMGERLIFFPSMGFCLIMALLIEKLAGQTVKENQKILRHPLVSGTVIVIGAVFSFITFNRNADWADNYSLFSTDIQKAPDNCRLNYFLGTELGKKMYGEEKDPVKRKQILDEAIGYLSKAVAIHSDFREAHSNLAGAYLNNMKYDSAEFHAKRTVEINPKNASAINNLAMIYNTEKKYPQAIGLFKKLIELDPGYRDAQSALGNAYICNAQYDSGEVHELIALQENPQNLAAIKDLAKVYFYKKQYPQAIALCKRAIKLEPEYADTYIDAAACYITLSKFDSSIYYLNLAISAGPHPSRAYEYLGISYKAIGKIDSARKYEVIAQKKNPGFKL